MIRTAEGNLNVPREQLDGADYDHGTAQGREGAGVGIFTMLIKKRDFDRNLIGNVTFGFFGRGRGRRHCGGSACKRAAEPDEVGDRYDRDPLHGYAPEKGKGKKRGFSRVSRSGKRPGAGF